MSGVVSAVAIASTVIGTGMSIIGSIQQSNAQREAGEAAYQNALQRNQQAQEEAKRLEAKANADQAASQRQAIEEKRKASALAGRAKAVMAASGAGVDNNIIDGILAEGEYGFDVALYEGDTRAQSARYDANIRRWEGDTAVAQGAAARSAYNSRADSTLTSGLIGGVTSLGSMATKYAGPAPGAGINSTPGIERSGVDDSGWGMTDWKKYA